MKSLLQDIKTIAVSFVEGMVMLAIILGGCYGIIKASDWAFAKGEQKDQPTAAQLRRQTDIINMRHLREPMNAMEINALMDAPKVRSIKEGTR